MGWPATGSKDLNGQEFILDADGDTSITADTDDKIDVRLLAKDQFEFLGTSTNEGNFTSIDTDTGAAAGPIWAMYRNATGATSDVLGRLLWQGKDAAGNKTDFSQIEVEILDPTAGTEDSTYNIWNTSAGTLTEQWHIGLGVYPEGFTDPGVDNVAADTFQVADRITHIGDTDTYHFFTPDAQGLVTGGTNRLGITNSGIQLGAANAIVTTILDEDDLTSDSATALATQQSIKAYIDTTIAANLDFEFVSTTAITGDPTAVSAFGFVIGYDYKVVLEAVCLAVDNEDLWLRLSDDGSTYESGAADYGWGAQTGAGIGDASDAQILLTNATMGNDAGNVGTWEVTFINPMGTSEKTTLFFQGIYGGITAGNAINITGSAIFIQGTDNIHGFQFLWSSGSAFKNQGDVTVWRRKRS